MTNLHLLSDGLALLTEGSARDMIDTVLVYGFYVVLYCCSFDPKCENCAYVVHEWGHPTTRGVPCFEGSFACGSGHLYHACRKFYVTRVFILANIYMYIYISVNHLSMMIQEANASL